MRFLGHMELTIPTVEEAPTVDLKLGAAALGIRSETTAYRLAETGSLCDGVPVLRIRGRWRVPTAPLRRALGLDDVARAEGGDDPRAA
jgi:hypothetical protein